MATGKPTASVWARHQRAGVLAHLLVAVALGCQVPGCWVPDYWVPDYWVWLTGRAPLVGGGRDHGAAHPRDDSMAGRADLAHSVLRDHMAQTPAGCLHRWQR